MLEDIALDPVVAALAALAGVVLGLVLGRFVLPGPRKVKRLQAEIEEMRREHETYRGQVGRHFRKTGELIGQMTASYKAVYDHLAAGAQTLGRGENALPGSTFSMPRLVVDDAVDVGAPGDRKPAEAEKSASSAQASQQTASKPTAVYAKETPEARQPAAGATGAAEQTAKADASDRPATTADARPDATRTTQEAKPDSPPA